jgi:DNA-binding MurR/RpiR family transcriptional regulator
LQGRPHKPPMHVEAIRKQLAVLATSAAPRVRILAGWLVDRPEELAFNSVRSLAELADSNPNTVVRLVQSLGFSGFEEARSAVQQALRGEGHGYAARAAALTQQPVEELIADLQTSAMANVAKVFESRSIATIKECVPVLLGARKIHCIGVRMGYPLAHYFIYRGSMAHANIAPAPLQPGLLLDALAEANKEDVVIVISFAHYSTEILHAAEAALAQQARLLAITDSYASPLARGAWQVLCPPLQGPNLMFPLSGPLLMIETLLEAMAAQDPGAQARIDRFETRLLELGAYQKA